VFNWALVAGPLSPLKPAAPFPAARVKTPVVASDRRTAWFATAKKKLPAASTAIETGCCKAAEVAGSQGPLANRANRPFSKQAPERTKPFIELLQSFGPSLIEKIATAYRQRFLELLFHRETSG
jgi:hypothetical protein